MNDLNFTFSDLISGYVTAYDEANKLISIQTSDGRDYQGKLTGNTYAKQTQNLGEGWPDRSGLRRPLSIARANRASCCDHRRS